MMKLIDCKKALRRPLAAIAMLAATTLAAQADIVCQAYPFGGVVCNYVPPRWTGPSGGSPDTCGDRFFDAGPCN